MDFTVPTANHGPLEEEEENRNQDLQESLICEPAGTRESSMQPTCAACSMDWSIQLEKGLRSSKPGVPVHAVLQMGPHLHLWSAELESNIASNAMSDLVSGEDRLFATAILLHLVDAFRGGAKKSGFLLLRFSCLNGSIVRTGSTSNVKGCCQRQE